MADASTLHSRLRVLIAKTFRAEKLFQTMKSGERSDLAAAGDLAGDIRAREWQRAHGELRTKLGEIVALSQQSEILTGLVELRARFAARALQESREIEVGVAALNEAGVREEFAHALRLSVELIRLKSRAQVHTAIADELGSVLGQTRDEIQKVALERAAAELAHSANVFNLPPVSPTPGEEHPTRRGKILALRPRAA